MKAKDKANDLVDRFLDVDDGIDYENGCGVTFYQAKQCALICVDEMVQVLWHSETMYNHEENRYYIEVKQEIEKL